MTKGNLEIAIDELEKSVEYSARTKRALGLLGYVYGVTGRRDRAKEVLGELKNRLTNEETTSLNIAEVYLGLGENDQTFAWMEKEFEARGSDLSRISWYPHFQTVRSDPRFADLVERMGLPAIAP